MNKTVKKIAEAVIALSEKYDIYEDTALEILKAAAGGEQYLAEFVEDELDMDEDEKRDCCPRCADDDDEEYDDDEDEDEDEAVCETRETEVGKGNRLTVPKSIITAAEEINGELNSKKYHFGEATAVFYDESIDIYFGDKKPEYVDEEGVIKAKVISLNSNGALQFRTAPTFGVGSWVTVSVTQDGVIHID